MSDFSYIDLYSGIGGFRVALDSLGGKSLGFSEIDKAAIETYRLNFNDPEGHSLGDVTKIQAIPRVDMLVGGVPCQSWSVAGKMKGFEDPRGRLWFDTIKMVERSKPKIFIFENVKGLSDPRNQSSLNLIISSFEKLGYNIKYKVLNAFDFGCPQNRSRIFIVGFKKEYKKHFENFDFPVGQKNGKTIAHHLDLFDKQVIKKKKFTAEELFNGRVPAARNSFQKHDEVNDFFVFCDTRNGHTTIHSWEINQTTKKQKEICLAILKNRRKKIYGNKDGNPISYVSLQKLVSGITAKDIDFLIQKKILKRTNDKKIDLVHSKNSSGINGIYRIYLPNSEIFSTLTATGTRDFVALDYVSGDSVEEYKRNFIENIYNKGKFRQITPLEAARVQGFPKEFKLHPKSVHAHKQIGNSVAPPVVKALSEQIIKTGVFN